MRAALCVSRVASRGQPVNRAWLETAATMSFLRFGGDTLACRRFLEIVRQPELFSTLPLVDRLAAALDIPPAERAACIKQAEKTAARALADAADRGLTAIPLGDEVYPDLLRHLPDPPLVLWAKGDVSWLARPAVAVVGSRAATPAGLAIARTLARGVAAAGLVVVSGMARGIDGAAHEGALDEGVTVAVLGCGADRVYPWEHRALAARIVERGAIVSELPPGMPPLQHHFPLRNRIISGLSLGVVVVEASYNSGSLHTARAAGDQGRCLLAVPGPTLAGRHRGCHALIKDGARLVETVEDVLEELGWALPPTSSPARPTKSLQIHGLEGTMALGEAYSVDDLAARTGRPTPDLLAELGALEVAGRITRMAGGSYIRLD
ncbi:MAG TPA: DNA-processing protein DprA [Vicinamibacterales bacterium]|nr:DNA-processing protein DprA [Vicinamibacterales bacterium]